MGLFRKTVLIGTGGLAPIKANSKKARTAKAAEKQTRILKQMQREANRIYNVTCPGCRASLKAPAGQAVACPKCGTVMNVTPTARLR